VFDAEELLSLMETTIAAVTTPNALRVESPHTNDLVPMLEKTQPPDSASDLKACRVTQTGKPLHGPPLSVAEP